MECGRYHAGLLVFNYWLSLVSMRQWICVFLVGLIAEPQKARQIPIAKTITALILAFYYNHYNRMVLFMTVILLE